MPINAEKILKESGALVLARELENSDTHKDIYLSRIIGIAYIRAIADLCRDEEMLCEFYLREFAALYEESIAENKQLIELIDKWRGVRETLELEIQKPVYDYSDFALGAATDWLVPCDWDQKSSGEWSEVDLNECSSGAAERVLGCFFETYIRLQPSVMVAKKLAEAAIEEEKKWRIGTKTEFRLVEDVVLNKIDEHLYELSRDGGIKKAFDKLVTSIAQECMGKIK